MVITSVSNEQVKNIIQLKEKAKARKASGCFVVEGMKMFREIPSGMLVRLYVSETFLQEHAKEEEAFDYQVLADGIFKKISDTVTPQGVLAVVRQKTDTVDEILKKRNREKSCIVVLDRLQDPGNLGTIIRTGEGAGISGVIMSRDCADIYSPKVIRATMGSIFRVPFAVADDLPRAVAALKEQGVTTYAAHLHGKIYHQEQFASDCAFLIGNEAQGLSGEISEMADCLVKIPMEGKVESLNAAVAASILMYTQKFQK